MQTFYFYSFSLRKTHMFCHCYWLLFSLFDHISSHTFPAFQLTSRKIRYNVFDVMNLLVIFLPLFVKVRGCSSGQEIGRVFIDEFIFVCSKCDAWVLLLLLLRNRKCFTFCGIDFCCILRAYCVLRTLPSLIVGGGVNYQIFNFFPPTSIY